MAKIWHKKHCQNKSGIFWKTVIFSNIGLILHHLVTLGIGNTSTAEVDEV